jgi:hypothetical protein
MKETIEQKWYRWDKMLNDHKYEEVIKEFDSMLKNKQEVNLGDLARRDQALESIGVLSIKPNISLKRKNNEPQGTTRRKQKA